MPTLIRRRPVLTALLLIPVAGIALLFFYAHHTLPLKTPLRFTITAGNTAQQLRRQKVLNHAWPFFVLARLSGKGKEVKRGIYQVTGPVSPWQILQKITKGEVLTLRFVVIEGWTWQDLRTALLREPDLVHDAAKLSEAALLKRLNINAPSLEGQFFPDTYHISAGASDLQLLAHAHRAMQTMLDTAWAFRAADLPIQTPYQALILASLIEKETGHAPDRGLVSGVFINRLRRGMRLQTDPSVIYGLQERYLGRLSRHDLQTDTPYNTYRRAGLPPTPIAFPGRAALEAAVNPTPTDALYFVARGDGTSHFSNSLATHNQAVETFILKRSRDAAWLP